MNANILFIVSCIGCFTARAQKPVPVIAIANYRFSQILDTTSPSNIYTEDMVLYIGNNACSYQSSKKTNRDTTQLGQAQSAAGSVSINAQNEGSKTVYFFYPLEQKCFQKETMYMYNYLFQIDYPRIQWKISNDTMSISGLRCQKAIGSWKGRIYTVWFCPDLPLSYGPWKLNGLPGLILEAFDAKKEIKFEFLGFQTNKNRNKTIQFPKDNLVKVNQREFARLHQLFMDDPKAYLESIYGPTLMNSVKISPTFTGEKPPKNPIELDGGGK